MMLWSIVFGLLSLCMLLFDVALDQRAVVVLSFLHWLRYEWLLHGLRVKVVATLARVGAAFDGSTYKVVNENFELCRSVVNLTDQHALLCEIRTGVHRTLRSVRAVLEALEDMAGSPSPSLYGRPASRLPVRLRRSSSPSLQPLRRVSFSSQSTVDLELSPSPPRCAARPDAPVLDKAPVSYEEMRRRFRGKGGSMSDGCMVR